MFVVQTMLANISCFLFFFVFSFQLNFLNKFLHCIVQSFANIKSEYFQQKSMLLKNYYITIRLKFYTKAIISETIKICLQKIQFIRQSRITFTKYNQPYFIREISQFLSKEILIFFLACNVLTSIIFLSPLLFCSHLHQVCASECKWIKSIFRFESAFDAK